MDIGKLILNPARLRILQYIRLHSSVRTSDIVEYLSDIPRATVYHHVKILEDNRMIEVIKENRVRGAVEKIYVLSEEGIPREGEASVALSTAFHMGLMQEMNEYLDRKVHDCKEDKVFFTMGLLYMADSEYDQLLSEISYLLKPYAERTSESGLTLRKLSMISSPPLKSEGKKES